MAYREVSVFEIKEVLRLWLRGEGYRGIDRPSGVDRKTVRRYVEAAVEAGITPDGGEVQLTDVAIGLVCERVRPARPAGHGAGRESLVPHEAEIKAWLDKRLKLVKIQELLARKGVVVAYRTSTASPPSVAASGRPKRRCGSTTASRDRRCRSTSGAWAWSPIPPPADAGWSMP